MLLKIIAGILLKVIVKSVSNISMAGAKKFARYAGIF